MLSTFKSCTAQVAREGPKDSFVLYNDSFGKVIANLMSTPKA